MPPVAFEKSAVLFATPDIISAFERMDRYSLSCKKDLYYVYLCALVSEIVISISMQSHLDTKADKLPPVVSRAINYISQNLDKDLSADSIAKALFVSKSYLCDSRADRARRDDNDLLTRIFYIGKHLDKTFDTAKIEVSC